jgi:GNAT superfamily N-acetyltransferase
LRQVRIARGTRADYAALAAHHYRARPPVAVALVGVAWHVTRRRRERAGVIVLTMPFLNNAARTAATDGRFAGADPAARARRLNAEVRTIARVVVLPRYRGIGLGRRLVRWALTQAGTRYVEAVAQMGHVHPVLERAGMRRVAVAAGRPAYFVWEQSTPAGGAGRSAR